MSLAGGRTLQILNAQQDSAGRYTCIATNEAGKALRHYEVKVYSMAMLSVFEICFYFAFFHFPHCIVVCPGEYKVSYLWLCWANICISSWHWWRKDTEKVDCCILCNATVGLKVFLSPRGGHFRNTELQFSLKCFFWCWFSSQMSAAQGEMWAESLLSAETTLEKQEGASNI